MRRRPGRWRQVLAGVLVTVSVSGCIVDDPAPGEVGASPTVQPRPARTESYGPHARHRVDVHVPAGWRSTDRRPVVVYLPGGAWMHSDRTVVSPLLAAQVHRGWVVLSADYRVAPNATWPAPVHDVDRLVRWVRDNTRRLGIDPDGIVLTGHSAGAHLALVAGLAPGRFSDPDLPARLRHTSPRVAGVVSLAAPVELDTLDFSVMGYTTDVVLAHLFDCRDGVTGKLRRCTSDTVAPANVLQYVSDDDPPVYVAHGVDDVVVPVDQAVGLYDELVAHGHDRRSAIDIVDVVDDGGRRRPLPAPLRGHVIDHGVHRAALEVFLDSLRSPVRRR